MKHQVNRLTAQLIKSAQRLARIPFPLKLVLAVIMLSGTATGTMVASKRIASIDNPLQVTNAPAAKPSGTETSTPVATPPPAVDAPPVTTEVQPPAATTPPTAMPSAPVVAVAPNCDLAAVKRYEATEYDPAVRAEVSANGTATVAGPEYNQLSDEQKAELGRANVARTKQHLATLEALGAQFAAFKRSVNC